MPNVADTCRRYVVPRFDRLRLSTGHLIVHQQKTAAELDALLPSILDKAFKGEL